MLMLSHQQEMYATLPLAQQEGLKIITLTNEWVCIEKNKTKQNKTIKEKTNPCLFLVCAFHFVFKVQDVNAELPAPVAMQLLAVLLPCHD